MANVIVILTDNGPSGPTPIINSFTPFVGADGSTVRIVGSNFTGAADVQFNGVSATSFTVVNDSLITAIAPSGFTSGYITVDAATSAVKFGKLLHGTGTY